MDDQYYDALLHIKTGGVQKGFLKSIHYHRYEPTPYSALEKLFEQYELKPSDQVVDFGCGKGRLIFYIHHRFQTEVIGVEMNEEFYQEAAQNRSQYLKTHKKAEAQIHLHLGIAEEYLINPKDTRFYFFNPFTIQIVQKTINNILRSVEASPREVELVLYYPSEDYIYFLENQTAFVLKDEIILEEEHNPNERFLVYQLEY
jgi:SAM-dependent methyltransferase